MSSAYDLFKNNTLEEVRSKIEKDDDFVISSNEDYRLEIDIAKGEALISITDLYSQDKAGLMVDVDFFKGEYEMILSKISEIKDDLIAAQSEDNLDRGIF